MFFSIKNFFLTVLGESDSNRVNLMVKRMQDKGKCVQIMDRTYILIIESPDMVKIADVREYISGSELWKVILIRLDTETNSAWCLKEKDSNYLKSIFKMINE